MACRPVKHTTQFKSPTSDPDPEIEELNLGNAAIFSVPQLSHHCHFQGHDDEKRAAPEPDPSPSLAWLEPPSSEVKAIIFLVDATDRSKFPQARAELHQLLETKELARVLIAVLGNKADDLHAVSRRELVLELDPKLALVQNTYYMRRPVRLFRCSVVRRDGYVEPLRWASDYLLGW